MVGIYKITSPSGKIYIGQSVNIERRFTRYNSLDCVKQIRLYKSFIKHNVINHKFEIIEECELELLNERERYYQDLYDVISEKGLNCILTETNNLPRILHNNTKINNYKSLKRGEKHHYSKKVINIITLKIYNSLSECCVENNLNPKYMSKVLSGNCKNKTDFLYFKEDGNYYSKLKLKTKPKIKIKKSIEEIHENRSKAKIGYKNPMFGKKGILNKNSKKVMCTKTLKIWNSLNECCKELSLNSKYMSRYLNGSRNNKTTFIYLNNEQ